MTGFNSKQRMAADKLQEPWNEDEWRKNNWRCGHGWLRGEQCEICNAPQPAQEPVAWMSKENDCIFFDADKPNPMDYEFWTPLYTAPPQRPWVGLTDEEIDALWQEWKDAVCLDHKTWAKAIEAALKDKNNGT